MYALKDIAVIIPTYNRTKDIDETLSFLVPFARDLCEIIIVDQSKNKETKKVVSTYQKNNKNLVYLYSKIPSITIARNRGVTRLSKKAKLICFIDDDVSLGKTYFQEILKIFNERPEAKAVAGYVRSWKDVHVSFVERAFRMLFRISYGEENRARMISAYGNTYPCTLTKMIRAQWLPGVNMVYKREIFQEQKFDEHLLGYTVAEDIDFTYRLYKQYPGSLFITPHASLIHRVSHVEREPTARMSYINQVDHFYFQFKHLNSLKQQVIFTWSLLGITFLRGMKCAMTRERSYFLKFKYFLVSLRYCLKNRQIIQQGKLREFSQT